jgi:D-hexose-6-phosphate mutarotase
LKIEKVKYFETMFLYNKNNYFEIERIFHISVKNLAKICFSSSNSKQLSIDNSIDVLGINNEIKITHSNK